MANKTLYVGNLPYSTTESQFADAFQAYGGCNARIIEGRGFGFIDVAENQSQAAIDEKNNAPMGDRTLNVNEARPRDDRNNSGRNNRDM